MSVTLKDIEAARARIKDAIYHSPTPYSLSLSKLCGCEIYCKLDHLQMTGSFKERGARNKLLQLDETQRKRGVIAASAGNHALGLAYHGQLLSIPVTVVMPKWAPLVKVSNCRSFGATVIIHGETFYDARQHAEKLSEEKGLLYVNGFDDPDIIAGQGTIGLEILDDLPDVDVVIVPVGGGGLIAGVGTAIKARKPGVRVIGVESKAAPTMAVSLERGEVTHVDTQPTLADGLAVARAGKLCFEIARQVVDEILLVDEGEIARAILRLLELEKMLVEGAGAVTLAAAWRTDFDLAGKKVVLILSGGNIDVTVLSHILERGLAADGRLCRITAHISDRPGGLAQLAKVIASTGASIKDITHDRAFSPADVSRVNVVCIIETRDVNHLREVQEAMRQANIPFESNGRSSAP
jgi:threonine dehydratase